MKYLLAALLVLGLVSTAHAVSSTTYRWALAWLWSQGGGSAADGFKIYKASSLELTLDNPAATSHESEHTASIGSSICYQLEAYNSQGSSGQVESCGTVPALQDPRTAGSSRTTASRSAASGRAAKQ